MADGNLSAMASGAGAKYPLHTFTFPESVKEFPTDPATITLRQLTYEEELQALQSAQVTQKSFAYEGAMRSVVEADGKAITWADNGKEAFFAGLSDKVRDLVIQAFTQIALPSRSESMDFLASKKSKAP